MNPTTQLTTSNKPTTFVATEVMTLTKIICEKEDIFSKLPVLQMHHPLACFFPRLDKLDDGRRWMGGKRSKINFWNEGRPSEKANLLLSRESTPMKDEAPQLMRLAIPVKLRATNQFARCTTPWLVSFPRLINWMMAGGEWKARGVMSDYFFKKWW